VNRLSRLRNNIRCITAYAVLHTRPVFYDHRVCARRKLIKNRKFVDASTEDSSLLSDYSGVNYTNDIKATARNNGMPRATGHVKRSSVAANTATRMNVHRTASFSFFNVFFDIVFWPFVFLRAKR